MAFVTTDFFTAYLNEKLEANEVYLPLNDSAYADLLSNLLNSADYTYLSLRGDTNFETVSVRNDGGTLVLTRGLSGTTAVTHHYGTCVSTISPTVIAAIKDLHCNYSCCEDGDCPCEAVVFRGAIMPDGNVGRAWGGSVVFSGDLPMELAVYGNPSWMTVTAGSNYIEFAGTPVASGTYTFSVAATNCNGTGLATGVVSVSIAA